MDPVVKERYLSAAKIIKEHLGIKTLPTVLLDDPKDEFDDFVSREGDEERILLDNFTENSLFSIKTVRFLKDFALLGAGWDLKTKNQSFLRTAEQFRLMGVKNYYFSLQLNNPLLQGVDPYDEENLTDQQKLMIVQEARENFWYFLREICKLDSETRFRGNRANISLMWAYLNHITTLFILPRQQGKATPLDSNVLTPQKGWVKMRDLKLGDLVYDRNGKETTVTGYYPQGITDVYRFTFQDGRTFESAPDHLWNIMDDGSERLVETRDIAEYYLDLGDKPLIRIPTVSKLNGDAKDLKISPTDFAELIGYKDKSPTELEKYLKKKGYKGKNLNLDRIPSDYLHGSREQRLAFLQGLLKGKIDVRDDTLYYYGNVLSHADAVKYLVRSLGGYAKLTKNESGVTGQFKTYQVKIDYSNYNELIVEEDKKVKTQKLFSGYLPITEVEYVGEKETACIQVANDEHLYVGDDFVVTHNTVACQCVEFWLTYLSGQGYKSHLITLKDDNRMQFIGAIKNIRASCPSYMTEMSYKDKDAGNSLSYSAFGEDKLNTMQVSVPQIGKDQAGNIGRGLTMKTSIYDEPAWIKWIEEIINGAGPSTLTARESARNLGQPYGTMFITTPNSVTNESGKYMYEMLMSGTEWRENFFDSYNESHLVERLLRASNTKVSSPTLSMVFNYMQLGKDRDWVNRTISDLHLSHSRAKIDLLLMWTEEGQGKLFDDLTREALKDYEKLVKWSMEVGDTQLFLDWFISKEEYQSIISGAKNDTWYIIGCDTSGAIDKDACTVVIRDIRNLNVIGVGRYPLAFLPDVGNVIIDILATIKNSTLIIERNYAAQMIDQFLIMLPALGIDPFKRIFNQIYNDPIKYEKEYREIKQRSFNNRSKDFYLRYKAMFGFNTTKTSREELYNMVQESVALGGMCANYSKLIDELINLRVKNGRIDHESKGHDDLVIAWLLTFWFIKLAKSKTSYGIPDGIALKDVRILNTAEQTDKKDEVADARIMIYRRRIQDLTDKLMITNDQLLANRIEMEINKVSELIPTEVKKTLTIDSLILEARNARAKRILERRRRSIY